MPTEGVAEVGTGVEVFPIEVVRSGFCTIAFAAVLFAGFLTVSCTEPHPCCIRHLRRSDPACSGCAVGFWVLEVFVGEPRWRGQITSVFLLTFIDALFFAVVTGVNGFDDHRKSVGQAGVIWVVRVG
ncbi:hypothetical protein BDZ97DRAFT_1117909 [Flammula alnicola]|nr:hypothetical protein BDZ97DRAFT_1117909 [Flammula alnicola]